MNHYENCTTIEEAKSTYRTLCKKYHPDNLQTGDPGIFRAVVDEFQKTAQRIVFGAYHAYQSEKGYSTSTDFTSYAFAEILAKIVDFDIDIELIGYWIYAFNAYKYREQLKAIGFWFSKKHKAWIFSGGKKKRVRTRYTRNDVRYMHGSQIVREKEETRR